jgi:hypothetical protein
MASSTDLPEIYDRENIQTRFFGNQGNIEAMNLLNMADQMLKIVHFSMQIKLESI